MNQKLCIAKFILAATVAGVSVNLANSQQRVESPPNAIAAPNPCRLDTATFAWLQSQFGLAQTASWGFTPHDLPASSSTIFSDPLNANTHSANPNDPWTTSTNTNLWPASLGNIQFSSNTTPGGSLTPRGLNALKFSALANGTSVLTTNVPGDSLNIVCGAPGTGWVQGMILGFHSAGTVVVRVYYEHGSNTQAVVQWNVVVPSNQTVSLGFIKSRLLRVDIFQAQGNQNLVSVKLYRQPTCASDINADGIVNIDDLVGVITGWAQTGRNQADVNHNGIVNIDDLVIVITSWGQSCPTVGLGKCFGEDPAGGSCSNDGPCFPGYCSFQGCTPGTCLCGIDGQWMCTDDCCGHCSGIGQ